MRRAVTTVRFVFEVARAGVAASLLLSCRQTPPPVLPYDFGVGAEVVRAMYDRYLNRWPETLVLVQHNTPSGPAADSLAAIWLTAVQLPARLRIDYEPRESGNGVLLVRDTQYVVRGGRSGQGKPVLDPLLLLQHDVYFRPPSETIARLRQLGVNVDRVRADVWDGRQVFVLGDDPTAQVGRQVWIDRELMLLVRLIEAPAERRAEVRETRLLQYERMGSAWVPREVVHLVNGARVLRQENRQIRADVLLDSALFQPQTWSQARHWYQQALLR